MRIQLRCTVQLQPKAWNQISLSKMSPTVRGCPLAITKFYDKFCFLVRWLCKSNIIFNKKYKMWQNLLWPIRSLSLSVWITIQTEKFDGVFICEHNTVVVAESHLPALQLPSTPTGIRHAVLFGSSTPDQLMAGWILNWNAINIPDTCLIHNLKKTLLFQFSLFSSLWQELKWFQKCATAIIWQ